MYRSLILVLALLLSCSESREPEAGVPDGNSPTWPGGAQITAVQAGVDTVLLDWTPALDDVAVTGYVIRSDGQTIAVLESPTTSFTLAGLEASQTYVLGVEATDAAGNVSTGGPSVTITMADDPAPDDPAPDDPAPDDQAPEWPSDSQVQASDVSPTGLVLSWTPAQDDVGVVGYRVYRDLVPMATVAEPTYAVTGLSPWATYSFQIQAMDAAENLSIDGPTLTTKTSDEHAPTWPPGNELTVAGVTAAEVLLGWTPAIDDVGVAGYQVLLDGQIVTEVSGGQTSAKVDGLTALTTYVFVVQASDGVGNISADNPSVTVATTDASGPTWPEDAALTIPDLGAAGLTLAWTPATDDVGVTGYRVYRQNVHIGTVNGSTLAFDVTGLAAWNDYAFRVEAVDGAGAVSIGGPTVSVKTPDPLAPTWAPAGTLGISELTPTSVLLSWSGASDDVAVVGYRVFQDGQPLATVPGDVASYAVGGLQPWTDYVFAVEADDAAANTSTDGPTAAAKTPDGSDPWWPPGAQLTSADLQPTSVALSWPPANDDVGVVAYRIYRDGFEIASTVGAQTGISIASLAPWTSYLFSVAAEDAAGNLSTVALTLTVTTPDTAPPTWPADAWLVPEVIGPKSMVLTWSPAQDDVGVVSYRLYQDGQPVDSVAKTTAVVTGLLPESQYSFAVQALDAAGNESADGPTTDLTSASATWTNESVYALLKPTCQGCHAEGTYPFFASLTAFENGLAYDPAYVVGGNPSQSELVHLLNGVGTAGYSQMPPGQDSFADLEAQGKTLIGVADVEAWIQQLVAPDPDDVTAPTDVVLNRRQRAEHIVRNLYDHLGLKDSYFWGEGNFYGYYTNIGYGVAKYYPVRSPDEPPGYGSNNSPLEQSATERFLSLGGPDWGEGHKRSQLVGPTFLLTLTQTAQAHCRMAFDKKTPEVLPHATMNDTSQSNPVAIKANIGALHLRFLGEQATAETVEELFALFQLYEQGAGGVSSSKDKTMAAWVSVCAALLRSPLWLTY